MRCSSSYGRGTLLKIIELKTYSYHPQIPMDFVHQLLVFLLPINHFTKSLYRLSASRPASSLLR